MQFDAFTGVEKIVNHPRRFGLTNVTEACIQQCAAVPLPQAG